jgi:hypothetical protein
MTSNQEKQLLWKVLTQLESPQRRKRKASDLVLNFFLWMLAFCLFLIYFRYGGAVHWTACLLGAACLGLGHLFSHRAYKRMSAQQWPVIAPYFDRAKIEERLRGLGA